MSYLRVCSDCRHASQSSARKPYSRADDDVQLLVRDMAGTGMHTGIHGDINGSAGNRDEKDFGCLKKYSPDCKEEAYRFLLLIARCFQRARMEQSLEQSPEQSMKQSLL